MSKKRFFRNLFLIVGAFVLLLIILAEIFKDKMVKMAIERGAKTFEVPLGVGEVDFSLLYRFPLATIEFNDLVMMSEYDSLSTNIDTVAGISKLYASVDMIQLMKGNILVKKIEIEDVKAKYMVDSLGKSNFDFLLEGGSTDTTVVVEDSTKVQGVYTLDKLVLSNIELEYVDEQLNTSALVYISDLEMDGEVESTGFKASTEGEVVLKEVCYSDYNCNKLSDSKLNFAITALNDTVQVSELMLQTGTASIGMKGNLVLKDSVFVDVHFSGTNIDIGDNLAILPKAILSEYKINKASGKVSVDGSVKGFLSEHVLPQLDINVGIKDGIVKYDTYPEIKGFAAAANLSNGPNATMESTVIKINQLHAETGSSKLDITGSIKNPEHPQYDMVADISSEMKDFLPFIPDSLMNDLAGNLRARINTSGTMPDSITDAFTDYLLEKTSIDLAWNDIYIQMDSVPEIVGLGGALKYNNRKVNLSDFKVQVPEYSVNVVNAYLQSSFKGEINDYENLALHIDSLLFQTPNSALTASGKIDGFKDVKYSLGTAVHIDLAEILEMLPDSLANNMSGTLAADMSSSGAFNIDSVADKAMALLFENSSFSVDFEDVYLNMPDTLMNVKMLSGNIDYRQDSLWMNDVSGSYLGLDFSADSTTISNVYTAAIQNNAKELLVQGNFGVGDIDYAWVESFMVDTVAMDEAEMQAQIQAKLKEEPYVQKFTTKVMGKAKAKSFKYGDVLAENIDSKFLAKVDEGYYVADELFCNVFGGGVKASIKYEMEHDLKGVAYLKDIMHFKVDAKAFDVSRLMGELESYIDNEDFKKENVIGSLSGKIDGKVELHDYNVIYEKMLLKGDILLEDGALINVKPVMDVEDISMIKLQNMDKLYFSTLESKLFLFKNKMYFPRTDIQTSSFDAMFFGMYSFGEDYAYHIRMYLNQLLSKNDKDNLNKASKENGFDETAVKDGKRPIYVVSSTKKTGLDNPKDRDRMDARVNLQEQMVEFRFDPKLVLYNTEE